MPVAIKNTDLVYFPVPKVACTSIKHAILAHNDPALAARIPERSPEGRVIRHVHDVYPSRRFTPGTLVTYRRGRWFCAVRDPLRRFLSAYANRVLFHDDITKHAAAEARAAGLTCRPEPDEFAINLKAYCRISGAVRHHVRPQHVYLGRWPRLYDRIFRLSEMDDLAAYCAAAGAPLTIPHEQTGGPKIPVSALSQAAQDKLRHYYRHDYRLYGAFFD